ncbi:MAG: hypothetical protein WC822_03085 [Candidatus Paceibacterota bacterium]|jgi:hypothetical protein
MTEKLKQTIKEEIIKLPKEMQEVINAFDWIKISKEIAEKYLLNEKEINNFQLETLLVLLGVVDPEFYAINIENQVEITKEKAKILAMEIEEKVFNPIYKKITENIKNNLQDKNLGWKQTIDFILSNGDYSVFIERTDNQNISPEISETNTLDNSSKIADIKNKFVI